MAQLLYDVPLVNPSTPQPSTSLLGLVFQKSSQILLICDLSNGIVWQANPKTGNKTVFHEHRTGVGGRHSPGPALPGQSGIQSRRKIHLYVEPRSTSAVRGSSGTGDGFTVDA